eukprot:c40477_g1_i1 orf=264-707(-)
MASVAMATLSSVCSSAPSSSASSGSSSVLRQASLQPLFSRVKLDTSKEVTMLPCLSFGGLSSQFVLSHNECNRIVTHAVAEALIGEPSVEAAVEAPVNEISKLKMESDLLKKKAKRAELRRRRLVRKRHMRKKGRWPPSKMAKLKNV